jgi:hypothetical protein
VQLLAAINLHNTVNIIQATRRNYTPIIPIVQLFGIGKNDRPANEALMPDFAKNKIAEMPKHTAEVTADNRQLLLNTKDTQCPFLMKPK